jgi:hypothetical protein
VEAEHVRVAEAAHGGHLAEHARRHARRARHLGLVDHLHRHGVTAGDGAGEVDLGERAAAQQAPQLVLAEQDLALVLPTFAIAVHGVRAGELTSGSVGMETGISQGSSCWSGGFI